MRTLDDIRGTTTLTRNSDITGYSSLTLVGTTYCTKVALAWLKLSAHNINAMKIVLSQRPAAERQRCVAQTSVQSAKVCM